LFVVAALVAIWVLVAVTLGTTSGSSLATSIAIGRRLDRTVVVTVSNFVLFSLVWFRTKVEPQAGSKASRLLRLRFRPKFTFFISAPISRRCRIAARVWPWGGWWFVRIDTQFRSQISPGRIECCSASGLSVSIFGIVSTAGLEAGNHLGGNGGLEGFENLCSIGACAIGCSILDGSALGINADDIRSFHRRRFWLVIECLFFFFFGRFSGSGCSE
jgi:hypothetical protein